LAAFGCGQRKPAVSDEDFAAFRQANPGMTKQCLDAFRYGGDAAWRPDDPDCLEMLPPQRWSGATPAELALSLSTDRMIDAPTAETIANLRHQFPDKENE
jgi:hypothetical protein